MEMLAHRINKAIAQQSWKPFCINEEGPLISHLFFTEDLVLFAEASSDQVEVINKVLEDFCSSSGQRVNRNKTRIFFI